MHVEQNYTHSNHVTGDVADTTGPALRRVVQDVVDANAAVLLYQGVKVLSQENVLGRHVGKDQVDLSLVAVGAATNNSTDDLEHRGDSGAASNHAEVTDHVGCVDEGTLGPTDANDLANHQGSHVLGDVTLGIGLDQEIKVSGLVVAGDWGV